MDKAIHRSINGKIVLLTPEEKIEKESEWEESDRIKVTITGVMVKNEARRRIDLIRKDYEQQNDTRWVLHSLLTHGLDYTKWPQTVYNRYQQIKQITDSIDKIRQKSKDLRNKDIFPRIPTDYMDDKYWL